MKTKQLCTLALLSASILSLASCSRSNDDVWDDAKSAGRHWNRGMRSLGGKQGDSRQIRSKGDFEAGEDGYSHQDGGVQDFDQQTSDNGGYTERDYIPIKDSDDELAFGDVMARPPRETPGEAGSSIPGIEAFRDPATKAEWAAVFTPIYFDYDSTMVKGQDNFQIIHNINDFLRSHSNVYIFIEGHADERGPQAYNFSLGARRANAVRNMLISEGADPDHLFTVSYGKERPAILESHEGGWAKNRRDEFKIYER